MSNIKIQGNVGGSVTGDTKKNTKITISIGSIVIIVAIAFIFFLFPKSIEEKIIGTWQNDDNTGLYITFSEDNLVMITDNNFGTLNGTYIFTADGSIKMDISQFFLQYIVYADISIEHNTLILENVNDNFESGTWLGGDSTTSFTKIK